MLARAGPGVLALEGLVRRVDVLGPRCVALCLRSACAEVRLEAAACWPLWVGKEGGVAGVALGHDLHLCWVDIHYGDTMAPQQLDEEMPQAPSPPTTQEKPRTEPLTHPITTMELPPQHRSTPDRSGFRDLPQEWAVHNGTLRWDEITPGLQAIRLQSITEPTTRALQTGRHHLLVTVQGDATITITEGDPVTAAPAHAVHIPPQASSAPMTVHPGPTPWQAIVITYPAPNDHTHTWQQR